SHWSTVCSAAFEEKGTVPFPDCKASYLFIDLWLYLFACGLSSITKPIESLGQKKTRKNTVILKGKMAEPTQKKMTSFSDSNTEDPTDLSFLFSVPTFTCPAAALTDFHIVPSQRKAVTCPLGSSFVLYSPCCVVLSKAPEVTETKLLLINTVMFLTSLTIQRSHERQNGHTIDINFTVPENAK
ncbi:hypothetical protein STEG23_022766, partial [Scotinomys teguina]